MPIDGAVPIELMPTPLTIAADALGAWIAQHPNADVGGVALQRDGNSIKVYWKGTPPPELQTLAAAQPMPVIFHATTYSAAELDPIARQLMTDHGDTVSSTGPSHDYSGISVTLRSTAPAAATMAKLNAESPVPVIFWTFADPVDLTTNT
ncbi:hypothetical protein ACFWUU_06195 [Kribbella sp. NPDC058693]|uniref:hypothetical protein n=1 Tax=Kribbella sp. NPDC058693 TaxID=3346602 RepID=UPI003669DF02